MKSDADILRLILAEVEKSHLYTGLCSTLFSVYSSGACDTEEYIRGENLLSQLSIIPPYLILDIGIIKKHIIGKPGAKAPRING